MSAPGYKALKSLGYVQFAANSIDTATLVSSATFPGQAQAGIPPGTMQLIITCAAQAIRWRDDGVAPTAAAGYPLAVGVELRYDAADFPRLQVISQTAGAILNVVAYGQP